MGDETAPKKKGRGRSKGGKGYYLTATLLRGWAPYRLVGSTPRWWGVRVMKRLAVTYILIGGDCDEGEGDSLCRLASVQLLDNGAEEGGSCCPTSQAVR